MSPLVLLIVLAVILHNWSCFLGWLGTARGWPWCLWSWLRETPDGHESGSTTIRNLALILAGLIALPLTLWRIRVADRQAKAAQEQVATSQRQVETAQRSLLNERYQKGAEMLGSDILSVRLGGIYALARLAREHPEEYHIQIMRLFCAYVRNPPLEAGEDISSAETNVHRGPEKLRPDVQEIMTAIGKRSDSQIEIELQENYKLDLHKVNLNHVELVKANLSNANLQKASLFDAKLIMADLSGVWMPEVDLSKAELISADLSGARLIKAKLHVANLHGAKLYGASFSRADLSGAILFSTRGLTQKQLDSACADSGNPPDLGRDHDNFESGYYDPEPPEEILQQLTDEQNAYDVPEINEPLVWRGKPLNE